MSEPLSSILPSGSSVSIDDIRSPIQEELGRFQVYFKESMASDVPLLSKVTGYFLKKKGKQLRPMLVFLSAGACGQISDTSYHAAALVELLHSATLIHDDVVDEADRRRGVFTINALWKNKVSVLLGDYLLSRGLLLALENNEYELLQIVSNAVRRMSEGELLQIQKSRMLDIDEETYFRIISDKTASLIAACTACGAQSTAVDPSLVERMRSFGEKLGLAFQIRDDLFDFGTDNIGKPIGIDLKEKKMTLPLIFALRDADSAKRRSMMRLIRKNKKRDADIRTLTQFVDEQGGLDYARSRMRSLAGEAMELLLEIPQSIYRESLVDMVNYVVVRKH